MNAIISVVGKDQVGILSFVSSKCSKNNANIVEVSQTIIDKYFTMFMSKKQECSYILHKKGTYHTFRHNRYPFVHLSNSST